MRSQRLPVLAMSLSVIAAGVHAPGAAAQTAHQTAYPERQIHVLIGFPPGSGADILGRFFSRKLSELAGKPVVVENKPGATSNIAVGVAARAKPDGYTLLYSANSNMAGNRFLFKELPFDTVNDFVPVALLSETTFFTVVSPTSSIKTVGELTAALKANPKAKFAFTNQVGLLATEFYKAKMGVTAVAVNYRTAPEALPDLHSGTIDFMIIDGTFGLGQMKAGRIKPLAVTTAQRLDTMPEIPTMAEAGVPGFDFASWWAAWLPKGTPQPIVDKLEGWFTQITAMPETREFLSTTAGTALKGGSAAARAKQLAEIEKWAIAVKAAGITPQ